MGAECRAREDEGEDAVPRASALEGSALVLVQVLANSRGAEAKSPCLRYGIKKRPCTKLPGSCCAFFF